MKIKTKRGYTGDVIGQSLDGKDYHVVLYGNTYDIDHNFDIVPKADCEEVVEPKRWRAEKKERYFYITAGIETGYQTEYLTQLDACIYEAGNYFRTEKQCEAAAEAMKAVLAWVHDPEEDRINFLTDILGDQKTDEMCKKLNAARDAVQEG